MFIPDFLNTLNKNISRNRKVKIAKNRRRISCSLFISVRKTSKGRHTAHKQHRVQLYNPVPKLLSTNRAATFLAMLPPETVADLLGGATAIATTSGVAVAATATGVTLGGFAAWYYWPTLYASVIAPVVNWVMGVNNANVPDLPGVFPDADPLEEDLPLDDELEDLTLYPDSEVWPPLDPGPLLEGTWFERFQALGGIETVMKSVVVFNETIRRHSELGFDLNPLLVRNVGAIGEIFSDMQSPVVNALFEQHYQWFAFIANMI